MSGETVKDKRAVVELMLRLKNVSPIHCIFKCPYAGVILECNVCLNPEVYENYPQVMAIDNLVLSCPMNMMRKRS